MVKTNAKRSDVWRRFLELRKAAKQPVLLDSSEGWTFVCVPTDEQPEWDESLRFLEEFKGGESVDGPPFTGGWVGFLTYDWGLEQMGLPSRHLRKMPKMWWKFCEEVHAFRVEEEDALGGSFELSALQSSLTYEAYERKIARIHELLRAGESYQICFTQEFTAEFKGDPFALYTALFTANPSAMCFYAEEEGWALASNSPERLVSLQGGLLEAEPIKGTVGADEDPELLLNDEKSYAELTMIVDLLRNDLAQVAETGSVKVLKHQALMQLANVWHTYSTVQARLGERQSVADLLRSVFPGGSVTGCPKRRSMKWLDELEGFSRGAYCGSAGYVGLNGNADFNIMIRTATLCDGQLSFPVGGGIVMDSGAKSEWDELQKKLGVLTEIEKHAILA